METEVEYVYNISRPLLEYLTAVGWSRTRLAREAGGDRTKYDRMANGKYVSKADVIAVCGVLGVEPEDFFAAAEVREIDADRKKTKLRPVHNVDHLPSCPLKGEDGKWRM